MSFINYIYKLKIPYVFYKICIIGFIPGIASANEYASLVTEQDMYSDFSVTSATRLAQSPRDLPVSVTIIDRKMIEASAATEIPDLFRMVPGFRVTMNDGGFYSVFGHGSANGGGRNLEVLIDGLPVQSPVANFVDWLSLPIEINDIDYIEVMRGTSAAVYGINAFDGAINIITRKPFEQQGMISRVTYGDPNLKKIQVKYGFQLDDSTHTISVISKRNSGFENVYDNNENSKITYNGNYNLDLNNEIDVMLSFNTGFKDDEDLTRRERTRDMDSNYQYVKWKHKNNENEDFILKLYHYYVKYDDTYSLGLISDIYSINPALVPVFFGGRPDQEIIYSFFAAKSNRYGLDAQQNYNYKDLRVAVGAGLVYDEMFSENLFGDKKEASGIYRKIFSNFEWQVRENVVLNAGLLAEKIEDRDTDLSSRLSINYHLNNYNTFRVGAARSFRGRTVYSANFQSVARYELDGQIFGTAVDNRGYETPEIVTTFEFAHMASFPDYNINFDWRLFKDVYDDFRAVVLDPDYPEDAGTGAFVSVNGGSYEVEGFEFQLKYEPVDDVLIALHYTKTHSKGRIVNNIEGTTFDDFNDAMPEKSFGIMLNARLYESVNLGLTYTRLTAAKWSQLSDALPEYDRLDANLFYSFEIDKNNARLELIAQNLLDDYNEFSTQNVFERRIIIRFTLRH